ncbi:MAG: NADH-quinone oxidoreductase subunit C [Deltaproteobacteria bacterium]|nr:NADH-quinone oxidoreductase subunit C [Deltaproteobacteria bacterium]
MQLALDRLKENFGPAVLETDNQHGNETAVIAKDKIVEVIRFLRDTEGLEFNFMMDLAGADYPEREERFEVVYHLYSLKIKKRIRLKVRVAENQLVIPTIISLYKAANWFEREAFDMYGIRFEGHPNLKRILTFDEFEGHPLRKDYPVNKRPKIPTPDPLIKV